MDMYDNLRNYFNGFLRLSDIAAGEIEKNFRAQRLRKGKLAFKTNHMHFIVQGCCCLYSKKNNKPVTHYIGFENTLISNFYNVTTDKPENEYIHLVEDSTFLSIRNADLKELYNNYHEWERLGRLISEDFGRRTLNLITKFRTLNAKQRYIMLLCKEPRVVQRIPLGHISSYLGISQETLSRIRSNMR